ncbi:MAG: ferredoxin [Chitinivibrionales bacterium]|nr:ferredoxin [Chitinivibrionales bacterium]
MRAIVDRDVCIGCEDCAIACPELFDIDNESVAVVKQDPVPLEAQGLCREVAELCPVEAIRIEENLYS